MIIENPKRLPLTVLNASAGSGKTHQLVLEYLTILLGSDYQVPKYKSIVAMTFTNKAALEMKTRIIETLDGIVNFEGKSKKIANMLEDLIQNTAASEEKLKSRAKKALTEILHGYEDFHVSTIDKFNLRLIRSFSRDLDIPGDFEVVLNEQQIIEEVVDLLMSKLGQMGSEELTKIMTLYAKTNLEEGDRWNFREQLVSFAMVLTSERYQGIVSKLLEISFSENDYRQLKSDIQQLEGDFLTSARELGMYFIDLGLTADSTPGANATVKTLSELSVISEFPSPKVNGQLFTNTLLNNCINPSGKKQFPAELANKIIELNDRFVEVFPDWQLLVRYRSNFFNMALLQFIANTLNEIKESEQILRISEFNKLISNLVGGEDAPYIYEKLGTHLEHFLLDEFQDTSRLQWLNLIPLVHESLSNSRRNLIVGDPKQSIYRFNNGLADQFVALPKIYNPEQDSKIERISSFFDEQGRKINLGKNFRSAREIVHFNNELFKHIKEALNSEHIEFYSSIEQEVVSDKNGFVRILSKEGKRDVESLIEPIVSCIRQCESDGFALGDICILTPTNGMGNSIANALTERKIAVVSQDSLLISGDAKVQLIISYLKRRERPTRETETRRFAELYFRLLGGSTDKYLSYFETVVFPDGYKKRIFRDSDFLNEYFSGTTKFFASYENLYDLALHFIDLMGWVEINDPYVHHFVDVVYDYQTSRQADISFFIDYFNENKDKLALQMPETDTSVKIMTIHKSKGLEFPVVILPQLDLKTKLHGQSKFLIESKDKILYSTISTKNKLPEIAEFAEKELGLTLLDKLNLCYVALTRPVQRMYGFNYFQKGRLGEIVHEQLEEHFTSEITDDGELILESGAELKVEKEEKISKELFYNPSNVGNRLWYPDVVFRKNASEEKNEQFWEQRFGNYFHLLMSECNRESDIEIKLNGLIQVGKIDPEFKPSIIDKATAFFNSAKHLFDGVEEFINEELILIPNEKSKRPDKILLKENEIIVIDFKTGKQHEQHQLQISSYQLALSEIFDKTIVVYLYYTETDSLLSV